MSLRHPLSFAVSFFVMIALGLLIGGDRLWATGQAEPLPRVAEAAPHLSALFTFFCGVVEPGRVLELSERDVARRRCGQFVKQAAFKTDVPRCADAWPPRDANGNVLQQGSYIQAVYVAFSPEDTGG